MARTSQQIDLVVVVEVAYTVSTLTLTFAAVVVVEDVADGDDEHEDSVDD